MIRLEDNIQNAVIIPRILHVPNKNGRSAESCYQRITDLRETVHLTKGFYNHDSIIMSH